MELILRAMNKWDSSLEHADVRRYGVFQKLTAEERKDFNVRWYSMA
jgi:hypothetical protein